MSMSVITLEEGRAITAERVRCCRVYITRGRPAPAVSQCGYHLSSKFETAVCESVSSALLHLNRRARTTLGPCCQSLSTAGGSLKVPKSNVGEQSLMRLSISPRNVVIDCHMSGISVSGFPKKGGPCHLFSKCASHVRC